MPKYYRDLVPFLASTIAGTAVACGTVSTVVTVPAGVTSVMIHAEGAAVYWYVNGASVAGTSAPGYASADNLGFIPPLDNLGSIAFIGSGTAAIAHLEYFKD